MKPQSEAKLCTAFGVSMLLLIPFIYLIVDKFLSLTYYYDSNPKAHDLLEMIEVLRYACILLCVGMSILLFKQRGMCKKIVASDPSKNKNSDPKKYSD